MVDSVIMGRFPVRWKASPEPTGVSERVLRRIRRERDLSQEALAALAGVGAKHMSEIERGKRDPRLSTLCQIADALGMRRASCWRASTTSSGRDRRAA